MGRRWAAVGDGVDYEGTEGSLFLCLVVVGEFSVWVEIGAHCIRVNYSRGNIIVSCFVQCLYLRDDRKRMVLPRENMYRRLR